MGEERKPRLSIDEQIEHMESQGIRFKITSKENAKVYLEQNTYYFKLKAYAKMYDKYKGTPKKDEYINLEFAYLQELAIIDSILRKEIIKISLDIEHYLKSRLIKDFNKTDSDGYEVVDSYISLNKNYWEHIYENNSHGKACSNLVKKYERNFAVWNIVEIMGLGDFQKFSKYFYSQYGKQIYGNDITESPYQYLINPVRLLRNAAAHNNCLISSLAVPYVRDEDFNTNPKVSAFLGKHGIKNKTIRTNMCKPILHDFCVMLYLYNEVAPQSAKRITFNELKDLFEGRISEKREYFENNYTILSAYEFIYKVIVMFCKIVG